MFNYSYLKKTIVNRVEAGVEHFVIYPYGQNGKQIEHLMKDDLEISSIVIADNFLNQYNESIVCGTELKGVCNQDFCVILTAQDPKINRELYQQLAEFCENDKIINILDFQTLSTQYKLPIFNGFRLANIIKREKKQDTNKKIKIRILNFSASTWNAIHSICAACEKDSEIDLLVLMGNINLSKEMSAVIEKEEYNTLRVDEYKVEEDRPDILVVSHPYDIFTQIKECRKYCKMIVAASMQLVRYSHNWSTFIQQQIAGFGRYYPDYYLFDSLLYQDMIKAGFSTENIFEMGNAKFDGIFEKIQCRELPFKWNKLKGKKIFLWTTDHGVHDGMITEDVTFDLYGSYIFDVARRNGNIGIIFRPHKTLIGELLQTGLWTEQDLENLKEYCEQSENVIFDDSLTYDDAFSVADAIITDAYCGITCSALPLLKPMCLLYRNMEDIPYHKEIEECNYSARSVGELISFMDMTIEGKDEKWDLRNRTAKKCIKHFDGKNGERIKEFMKHKFNECN